MTLEARSSDLQSGGRHADRILHLAEVFLQVFHLLWRQYLVGYFLIVRFPPFVPLPVECSTFFYFSESPRLCLNSFAMLVLGCAWVLECLCFVTLAANVRAVVSRTLKRRLIVIVLNRSTDKKIDSLLLLWGYRKKSRPEPYWEQNRIYHCWRFSRCATVLKMWSSWPVNRGHVQTWGLAFTVPVHKADDRSYPCKLPI